jgi:transitional endoplasmic reticulum ATPase
MAHVKQRSADKLMVEEATNDDNSVVALSAKRMENLNLLHGETVTITTKKRHETVCIVMRDPDLPDSKIRMNKVVRRNLRVHLGDIVGISPSGPIGYATKVELRPIDDTIITLRIQKKRKIHTKKTKNSTICNL